MTDTAAVPIYEGQDFYVPAFELKLSGRPPGQDVVRDILSVSYKDSVQDIDSFEISINNWDAATRAFKYSDLMLFDPGERVELAMGYQGQLPHDDQGRESRRFDRPSPPAADRRSP
jgi:phage protein D